MEITIKLTEGDLGEANVIAAVHLLIGEGAVDQKEVTSSAPQTQLPSKFPNENRKWSREDFFRVFDLCANGYKAASPQGRALGRQLGRSSLEHPCKVFTKIEMLGGVNAAPEDLRREMGATAGTWEKSAEYIAWFRAWRQARDKPDEPTGHPWTSDGGL